MTIRIVVDTSVFVSALIGSTGPSREVLRRCLQGTYQPLMGNALFCEYESIIGRENVLSSCPLASDEIMTLLKAFMSVCKWVNIYYSWRPNLKDEGDNHLVELLTWQLLIVHFWGCNPFGDYPVDQNLHCRVNSCSG